MSPDGDSLRLLSAARVARSAAQDASEPPMTKDPFLTLMKQAAAHAKQHGDRFVPALSPAYETLLGPKAPVHVKAMQAAGFCSGSVDG
jgi:hypothetical protein